MQPTSHRATTPPRGPSRSSRRRMTVGLALAVMVGLLATPVAAARPFHERFVNTVSEEHAQFTDLCGTSIWSDSTERGNFIEYDDGSILFQVSFNATYTGPGGVIQDRSSWVVHGTPVVIEVDEVAETRTESFTDRFTGLAVMWLVPGSGVLVRDAGSVTFDVTLVFDLETDELISVTQVTRDVKGPHPFIEEDFFDDACEVLT